MKKYKIFILSLLISTSIFAQQTDIFFPILDADALKTEINKVSENTQSIQSEFTQEKHLTMLEEVIVSKGRFLFRKENDVRWEYGSPIDYTIVIYKSKFSIKNGEKVSEFDIASNVLFQQINKMIVTAIRGDFVDNPEFEALFFENKRQYRVNLKATNKQVAEMLSGIEIFFNKEDLGVEQVRFVEPGEDYTLIIFKDRKVNVDIADNQFELNHD